MSRQEIVDAYVGGSLNRRAFVRRLIGTGVSAGAAVGYAQVLAPAAEAATHSGRPKRNPLDDLYPRIVVKVTTTDLKDVRNHQRLEVRVTSNSTAIAHFAAFLDKGGHLTPLGYAPYDPEKHRKLHAGIPKDVTIPLNQTPDALKGLQKAKVRVEVFTSYTGTAGLGKATLK
jgi:hypothetical protein